MSAEVVAFNRLMQRLRSGDETAARELFDQYSRRLIGLARLKLDRRLQARIEADDVVQSVFRTFFGRYREGEFSFADAGNLWGLLALITARKCRRWNEHYLAAKNTVTREVQPFLSDDSISVWEAAGPEPTAQELILLEEAVQQLLDRFEQASHRQIVQLRLEGYSLAEISHLVSLSERTVNRVLERVREHLTEVAAQTPVDGCEA